MDSTLLFKASIRDVKDFPKPGIVFKDITTLLNNGKLFNDLTDILAERYKPMNIDYIAGLDARGFIFGAALANKLNCGFVPIRKKGKLPSETISENYSLEYGEDTLEIHVDAFREGGKVLLIDDLLATGGTASAAEKLISKTNGTIVESCFIIELLDLNGRKKLSSATHSILKY